MIQHKDAKLALHGFLVGVELEVGGRATPEQVSLRLAESLSFIEDVGKTDVEYLGEIETIDEETDAKA
jgi:hypothetical protein